MLALLALLAAAPAAAEVACRPTALGTVACPAAEPRPMPRPPVPGAAPTQALDRVRARTAQPAGSGFIPARRAHGLGGLVRGAGGGTATTCRPDTLGNLRCR